MSLITIQPNFFKTCVKRLIDVKWKVCLPSNIISKLSKTLWRAEPFSGVLTNLPKQGWKFAHKVLSVENRKSEYHHWIQQIQFSLAAKFLLKQTIMIFRTKFAPKGYYSPPKQGKWRLSSNLKYLNQSRYQRSFSTKSFAQKSVFRSKTG